ncbi:MAG: hypothetical protein AAGK74_00105 [Chloroflexota bacterium]
MQPTGIKVAEQFTPHKARVITPQTIRDQKIASRVRMMEASLKAGAPASVAGNRELATAWQAERERRLAELYDGKIPRMNFPDGFDFKDYGRVLESNKENIFEITQGQFGNDFSKRLDYEVDAGRDEEPTLFEPIYDVMVDANFPKVFQIQTLRDVGVVMSEVREKGEVNFVSVGSGSHTITIARYASGIRYTDEIFLYNYTWQMGPIEREFGKAINALHNHAHLSPIISASYSGNNATAASSVGSTLYEKIANTLDAAITASVTDNNNPRRGPYVLLCSTSNLTAIERALGRVPQQGFNLRPSTMDRIQTIIAYDGWANTQGKKAETYNGVSANTCYLIHVGHRDLDFQSRVKIPLRRQEQDGDLKQFISREIVYDTHFGLYAAPTRAVQEITLPTS